MLQLHGASGFLFDHGAIRNLNCKGTVIIKINCLKELIISYNQTKLASHIATAADADGLCSRSVGYMIVPVPTRWTQNEILEQLIFVSLV